MDELDAALAEAHIPTLINALVHLTGDVSFLDGQAPVYDFWGDGQGNIPPEVQAEVRARMKAALQARTPDAPLPPSPSAATLRRMMDFIDGAPVPEHYVPFLMEELAIDGVDPKRPKWEDPQLKAAAGKRRVLIIGAGMSGLLTGIRLAQAGVEFTILEKNPEVGGTWFENSYPGCRVDNPNHMYSYSFERSAWPYHYSTADVLLDYFKGVADRHGLRPHIRFGTEVKEARWDEGASSWRVSVRATDGREETLVADAVVSAVGQLNQPKYPDIPGVGAFQGPAFHSARWDHSVELTGKRVAVIGTGASAFQFVPEIAPKVAELEVFQRTPPWLGPTPNYHDPVAAGKQWLIEHVPMYGKWYRFYLFWLMTDGILEAVRVDEGYSGPKGAVGEANAMLRGMLEEKIKEQLVGAEHLIANVIPEYPFGGKRSLRDNGVWIEALKRPNVHLVTEPIAEITATGVRTKDGAGHPADVLIYGTGFHASDFLRTLKVVGRGGRELHERWSGDARAYLGMTVPEFPNFFILYGPNTNIVVNGSIIFFSECSVRYVIGCLELLARTGSAAMEVKEDVHDALNAKIDAQNARMAWGSPEVSSWYKNATGRVSQNWPFPLVDYWQATLKPDPDDFLLTPGAEEAKRAA